MRGKFVVIAVAAIFMLSVTGLVFRAWSRNNQTDYFVATFDIRQEANPPTRGIFMDRSGQPITDPFFAPQVMGFARGDFLWGLEAQHHEALEAGHNIVTTLDSDIQRLAQQYVDNTLINHPSQFVGMIVMKPFTGEILAMAQAPNFSTADPFNPDYFTCPQLVEVWDSLSESQRVERVMTLWRNYHTTRSSEPSATFKPFVIAAAFEEGYIDSHSVFYCEGRRYINDQSVWCHNIWGCGMLSLRRSLYRSCNMAMVYINEGLGRDLFYQYRGYFGFGAQTGIGLPNEADVSSRYVMYPWARLHAVEMANSAMGQGFQATTMQMINGYAALINGGNLMRPFIVSQVINDRNIVVHENLPHVTRRAIAGETSNFIRNEMRYVVAMQPSVGELSGTGWRSYIEGVSVGGKTGTALQGDRESYNYTLTYIAFFPVEDPQFLVLLTLDNPIDNERPSAGYVVAPIVREFLVDLIEMKNLLT